MDHLDSLKLVSGVRSIQELLDIFTVIGSKSSHAFPAGTGRIESLLDWAW